MIEHRKTLCNRDCPDACGIVAEVENGRVRRIRGDKEHPVTNGFLCPRTSLFLSTQYSPERISSPLLRRGSDFEPVSWQTALDLAAERLTAIRKESGPAAIFHYRSGGSLGALKHLSDYFFEKFGPVTIKRGDICSGAGDAAQMVDFGEEDSNDLFDLLNARNILVWGKNVFTSTPHTVPVLREARSRGARIVLIDPVHHRTARLCAAFYQPRPGGDFALAMAVARILFEREWTDPGAASYCDHLDAFRSMAHRRSVEAWCDDADVAPSAAEDLARMLGPGRPTATLVGWGMVRRTNGAAIVRALDALAAVSGNLGIPGGGVSFYFRRRRAFDLGFIQGAAAAPRTVCEPLFGSEVLESKDPPIRAVWVTCGNPVTMLPDSERIARALRSREFVVVVDSFLTDTAREAHLVLPTTTLLEADDLLGAYGHHWIGVARPAADPPKDVKSDLEIIQGLADRVGLHDVMAGTAREWKERILSRQLAGHGIGLKDLEERPRRNPMAPKILFEDRKFSTASGKVNLIHEEPGEHRPSNGYPLSLLALSTPDAQCSQWAEPPDGPVVVTVHPDVAHGIPDGGICLVESAVGAMKARLRHDPLQRRDVAITAKGGHLHDGRCANALVQARITDLGEGGALYEERVRIRPL